MTLLLSEESLNNLLKRPNIVAPHTKEFSDIRRDIEGKPPRAHNSARLINSEIRDNSIYFYFLSGATDANPNTGKLYPKDHQYKDANPNLDFALEPNPSKTYDLIFKFEGLNKLTNLAKSRLQKKKFNPNATGEYSGGIQNISFEEALHWLWDTNIKVFSSSPAFHWTGQNYSLSQLNSSIYPTDIPPQKPQPGKWGWADLKDGSILDKHLMDVFDYLGFYLGQMARMLLSKIRNPSKPSKPAPKPVKPSAVTKSPKQSVAPAPEPQEVAKQDNTPSEFVPKADRNMNPPEPDIATTPVSLNPQQNLNNSNIETTNAVDNMYPGNPDQNPNDYDPNNPLKKESKIMWNKTLYGYEFTTSINESKYTTKLITKIEHAASKLLTMDSSSTKFRYNESMNTTTRFKLYDNIHDLEEVSILIERGYEKLRLHDIQEEVLDFIGKCRYPIITLESSIEYPDHAKMVKILAETLELAFPSYKDFYLMDEDSPDFSIILYNSNTSILREADDQEIKSEDLPDPPHENNVPRNDNHANNQHAGKVDTSGNIEDRGQDNKLNNLPTKKIVFGFGSFNPVTHEHIEMINSILKSAEKNDADSLIILQADPYFNQDKLSMQLRASILQKLGHIKVYYTKDILDFIGALVYVYTKHYTDIMVVAGNDTVSEMDDILKSYNGKESNEGKFAFNTFKVGSYGKNNPDKLDSSIHAVNAIMDNDVEAYLKAVNIPNIRDVKKLFYVAKYELENRVGMTEQIIKEASVNLVLSSILKNGIRYNNMGEIDTDYYGQITDKFKRPLDYNTVIYMARNRDIDVTDPDIQNLFRTLTSHIITQQSIDDVEAAKASEKSKRALDLQQAQQDRAKQDYEDKLRKGQVSRRPSLYPIKSS